MGETKKPKTMRTNSADDFQTDPWALKALLPLLKRRGFRRIWEPAAGSGQLVGGMVDAGFCVVDSDIKTGHDFLNPCTDPGIAWDCLITNPPFSLKDRWLEECYRRGKPFALLLPLTTFEGRKRQSLFRRHGVEVVILPKRVTFTTPNDNVGGAWFMTAWFTWGLEIGQQLTFWEDPDGC